MAPPSLIMLERDLYASHDTSPTFNSIYSLRSKRDGLYTPKEMTTLPARPINHLSVWAYIAIAVVVVCASVIVGYVLFSCYRSAKKRQRLAGAGEMSEGPKPHGHERRKRPKLDCTELPSAAVRVGRVGRGIPSPEVLALRAHLGHAKTPSETQHMLPQSEKIESDADIKEHDESVPDLSNGFSKPKPKPVLSHLVSLRPRSDTSASSIPLNRKFPDKPLPSTPRHTTSTDSSSSSSKLLSNLANINVPGDVPTSWRPPHKRSYSSTSTLRFDSNNIRFVAPQASLGCDSDDKLYNEKLSPVDSSLICPTPPIQLSPTTPVSSAAFSSSQMAFKMKRHSRTVRNRSISEVLPARREVVDVRPSVDDLRTRGRSRERKRVVDEIQKLPQEKEVVPVSGMGKIDSSERGTLERIPNPGYF